MSSPPSVERFKGSNWEECNEFILAIRTRALWEGKQRDPVWMADFAASFFWQKAMSWHCRLPRDVRHDWLKLEFALLDRWPPPEDDEECGQDSVSESNRDSQTMPLLHRSQIVSAPTADPSLRLSDKADPPPQGVLKIVVDGSNAKYYVTFTSVFCRLTTGANIDRAIRVHCHPFSGITLLERIDRSHPSWLAVQWTVPTPKIEQRSQNYAYMVSVDCDTLKSSWTDDYPFKLIRWTVSSNGELIPVWKKDCGSKITLFAMTSDHHLSLVANAGAFSRRNGGFKRGRFFIEPLN